jgi:ribonuclease T1
MAATRRSSSRLVGLLLVVALVVVVWLLNGRDPDPATDSTADRSPQSSPSSSLSGQVDPGSGLPIVALGDLPPEAADTVELIDSGGPFPYDQDGATFGNREGLLPDESPGYYREYTVETPGSDDRGARRIIGGDGDELYWTADHYASFARIGR